MQTSFFNTTREQGEGLQASVSQAKRQETVVLNLYREYWTLSPWDVQELLAQAGLDWPITSVRRAITVLTNKGLLVKTHRKVEGPYGKNNYVWRLRDAS